MPQIMLEVTDNLLEKDFSSLFHAVHEILTKGLPTNLINCKSRVVRYQDFLIGDGSQDYAFVHLSIRILKGRSKETLDAIVSTLIDTLKKAFVNSAEKLKCQFSVEIIELPDAFQKISNFEK